MQDGAETFTVSGAVRLDSGDYRQDSSRGAKEVMSPEESVRLEHRLTVLEQELKSVAATADEIKKMIHTQNEKMAAHFASDATWFSSHAEFHAARTGYKNGQLAVYAVLFAVSQVGVSIAIKLL